ncbi:hypothetical protein AB0I60_32180 [Actinosynnema sp. NPDC050436]|uniref:hypothetical protein n=1 Tax=Actinosynnema sp. NPDC050436 TaxID=3155659 RepID=UPI0033DE8F6D
MPGTNLAGADVAAAFLRELLNRPGRYRERWVKQVGKARDGEISQAAVARVIVDYVRLRSGATPDYRTLRSRVHRALAGTSLTADTLALFVGAFSIADRDVRTLWARFAGTGSEEVEALRTLAPPPLEAVGFQASKFEVLSSNEIHYVDENGSPMRHSMHQLLVARADGLARFPVQFDTPDIAVTDASHRCSELYRSTSDTYAFDLIFTKPLRHGDEVEISYEVALSYVAPQSDFRRIAVRPMSDMSIAVHFSSHNLPSRVWWASWRDPSPDSEPLTREPVPVDESKVSKRLSFAASSSIVGFCWTWSDNIATSRLTARAI